MATKIHLKHTKSSATTANTEGVTIPRLPSSGDLLHGEIAINYRSGYETLAIKNSENQIVSFPTNGQTIDATKPEGLVNGQIGMDAINGEESFYIYNGVYSKWQPVSTNYLSSESELSGIPVVKDPQIAYVTGTGLVYVSQYDDSTSALTWTPMASLVPGSKRLAHGQETKVVIDEFDPQAIAPNTLIYNSNTKKLTQYGTSQGMGVPPLLDTYTPSSDVIYYNKQTDKFFIWTGSDMREIKVDETPIFSANTAQGTALYAIATTANTVTRSPGSIVLGHGNSVTDANMVTIAGVSNTVTSGGDYSFVEGKNNTVSGPYSHAEGSGTSVTSGYSHAEGLATSAVGLYSHAEGNRSFASGAGSHAEGYGTSATGMYSHAEGSATTASGKRSHAEGLNNVASGENSHVGGRLSLAAGRDSFAHGYGNSAYCAMAVAMGSENIVGVPGDSHSADAASSVALGRSNSAMGYSSFVCGHYNYAGGMYSNAFGESTSARAFGSHSEGFLTSASAIASHAEGAIMPTRWGFYENNHSGYSEYDAIVEHPSLDIATSVGGKLLVDDWLFEISAATLDRDYPDLYGYVSVEGDEAREMFREMVSGHTDATPVYGQYFDPATQGTIANGVGSHAEGFSTYSEGQASHCEGASTSGLGNFSHAEGSGTTASGDRSHAEGYVTHANGINSHAEGEATYANGKSSHAGGNSSSAVGNFSYAVGNHTLANNVDEFACGKYNESTTGTGGTMFSVGVGTGNTARKNALEIRKDGKIYIYDNNGNQVCLQDILQTLQGYHS